MSEGYIEQLITIPIPDILRDIYGIEARQKGSRFFCKLRPERTGSCCIYETNTWYDFGANTGGNGINLIQTMDNCSPKDAMEKLANTYGITRPNQVRDRKELLDYEWKKLGIYPELVSKNLDINIVFEDSEYLKGADINLYPDNQKQLDEFKKYYVSVNEFRKAERVGYHNLLRKRALSPLLSDRDDYYAGLLNSYRLYAEIGGGELAKEAVITNPDVMEEAKQLNDRCKLLVKAVDDNAQVKIPFMHFDPAADLKGILNGKIQFQIGKLPYFELCRMAKSAGESIYILHVAHTDYIIQHTPNRSVLRGIPHSVFYQNGLCKVCVMEKDLSETQQVFEGKTKETREYSSRFFDKNATKNKAKTAGQSSPINGIK